MQFVIKSGAVEKQKTACLVLPVQKAKLSDSAQAINDAGEGALAAILKRGDLSFKAGKTLLLQHSPETAADRMLLAALSEKAEAISEADFIKMAKATAANLKGLTAKDATIALEGVEVKGRDIQWQARQMVEAVIYEFYRFVEYKSEAGEAPALTKVTLLVDRKHTDEASAGKDQGLAIAEGRNLARRLGDMPGNDCHPTYLAELAKEMAKGQSKLTTKVLGEAEMTKLGMHSLLSVGQASVQESRLIMMEYKGGKKNDAPVVLLGKGITFDTGGISLKPGAGMDEMKYDMCGSASVFGAMQAIVAMGLEMNVVGMVAAAENMPAGNASRPGDIVKSMSGQTIEILNTDAEGRLVLCDALTYAGETYKPKAIVDIATLTGACIIALGHHITGLISNNDDLVDELMTASKDAADKAWQLPMGEEFQAQLDSNFADMANIGGRPAGTITAGCFLSRFVEDTPWAHLDIAGTAWTSGKNKGATGRPVPMLVQYLLNQLEK
ncbi:leucyl aminopeptidase [Endozoicomonas sp. OPT23]|uniref:leucyl aminopeptidase n=1 Tax=Endozoicomonas sp. OPT23 TaxID=2072845 RepID=UPI00129B7F0A|nr:leucyl aminopeptidase [Endozoicomonas sp. OPT23]MRI34583.1 leucyl aminopeptidase [Endozoicomonas sp. OPT23]